MIIIISIKIIITTILILIIICLTIVNDIIIISIIIVVTLVVIGLCGQRQGLHGQAQERDDRQDGTAGPLGGASMFLFVSVRRLAPFLLLLSILHA